MTVEGALQNVVSNEVIQIEAQSVSVVEIGTLPVSPQLRKLLIYSIGKHEVGFTNLNSNKQKHNFSH